MIKFKLLTLVLGAVISTNIFGSAFAFAAESSPKNSYIEEPETIENAECSGVIARLILWGKATFPAAWTKLMATTFGKSVVAGAALGTNIVNDTRKIIIKGYQKISTHLKEFLVGDGKVTSGGKVRTAQSLLRYHGYNIDVDGIWGPKSRSATKSFQGSLKMSQDGLW